LCGVTYQKNHMFQIRLGAALLTSTVAAHYGYVYRERVHRAPQTHASLRFSPGSEDAWLADTLRTGDVLLFSRDCLLYGACGAAACALRQATSGRFDHAVVVRVRQEPFVLERTPSGARLRPFAARLRSSRARAVALRRVEPPLEPHEAAAGVAFAAAAAAPSPPLPGDSAAAALRDPAVAARALADAARAVTGAPGGGSAALVEEFFAAAGRGTGGGGLPLRALAEGAGGGAVGLGAPECVRDLLPF